MPNQWWQSEPVDLTNQRRANRFRTWAEKRRQPTAPWEQPDFDPTEPKGPPVGPSAAARFRERATQQTEAWRQGLIEGLPPTEPAELSRAPDLGPMLEGVGQAARGVAEGPVGQYARGVAKRIEEGPFGRAVGSTLGAMETGVAASYGALADLPQVRRFSVGPGEEWEPQPSQEPIDLSPQNVGKFIQEKAETWRNLPEPAPGVKGAFEVAHPLNWLGPLPGVENATAARAVAKEAAKLPSLGTSLKRSLVEERGSLRLPGPEGKGKAGEAASLPSEPTALPVEPGPLPSEATAAQTGPEAAARFRAQAETQAREQGIELGKAEPAPTTAPARKPLPPMQDNHLKPLSTYADTLYHETSGEQATAIIPTDNTSADMSRDIYFANTPDLALGQGRNQGVLLEFDVADLQGRVNTEKPTWQVSYQNGEAELIGRYNDQEAYRNALRAITIKRDAKMSAGYRGRIKRDSAALEAQGWTQTKNADGSVTYRKPAEAPTAAPPPPAAAPEGLAPESGTLGRPAIESPAEGVGRAEPTLTESSSPAAPSPAAGIAEPAAGSPPSPTAAPPTTVADLARQVSDDQLAVMRKRAVKEKDTEALAAIDTEMASRKGAPVAKSTTEPTSPAAASSPAADLTPAAPAEPLPRAAAAVPTTPAATTTAATGTGVTPPARPRRPASAKPEPPAPGAILGKLRDPAELDALITKEGNIKTAAQTITEATHGVGTKGLIGAVDPGLVEIEAFERVPHVYALLLEQGETLRQQAHAAMETALAKVHGVKVENGRYVEGVAPKGPNLSLAVLDVAEHPQRYRMPQELREAIDLYWKMEDERVYHAKQAGAKVKLRQYDEGGHHVSRTVLEIRGLEKEGRNRFDLARKFESAEEGLLDRIVYGDLLDSADAMAEFWTRKETNAHMQRLTKGMGKAPKDLIDQQLTTKALGTAKVYQRARNFERLVKQIRDGLSPYQTVKVGDTYRKALRPPLRAVEDLLPDVNERIEAAMKLKGKERSAAFATLATEAETLGKASGQQYRAARSARAKAIQALQGAEWAPASGATFGMKEDVIGVRRVQQPWASGRLFPEKVAKSLNDAFDADSSWLTKALNYAGGTVRTAGTALDMGLMFLHGLPSLSRYPSQSWKAAQGMVKYFVSPKGYSEYLSDPANLKFLREMRPHNLTLLGPDYLESLEQGGLLQKATAGLGDLVGRAKGEPLAGKAVADTIEQQVLRRVELLFEAPLNILKIEIGKALYPKFAAKGQLDDLGTYLANLTGTRSLQSQGIRPGQRSAEGMWAFFSPRYTRASMALIADALQGGLKGEEARGALARVVVPLVLFPVAMRALMGQDPWEALNPIDKPGKFLTFEAFGQDIGFGSVFRSYLTLLAASYKAGQDDPAAFLHPEDRRRHPLTSWWSGRAAPLTSMLWNLKEGRDYIGEPYTAGEATKNLLPIWARQGINAGTPLEFVGLRAGEFTPAEKRNDLRERYAQQDYGRTWQSPEGQPEGGLSRYEKWQMEEKYSDLKKATEFAQDTGERRGYLESRFWGAVEKQRAGPKQEIAKLGQRLRAGEISGNDYRQGLAEWEREMARVPQQLKVQDEYKEVPLTEAERKKAYGSSYRPSTHPVDVFIENYYGLTEKATDSKSGQLDIPRLMEMREALKKVMPEKVVKEGMEYIKRNQDPQYVKAQEVMAEYQRLPRWMGIEKAEERKLLEAQRQLQARRQQLPPGLSNRTSLALRQLAQEMGDEVAGRAYQAERMPKSRENPLRVRFRQANRELLDRFYSDLIQAEAGEPEPEQAAAAGVR